MNVQSVHMSLRNFKQSCNKKGNINRLIYASQICDPVSVGVRKVPSGYNEVIKNIQKNHPANTIELRE